MDVVTSSPLTVAGFVWQSNTGWAQTVVAKATFVLVPGEATLATDPDPFYAQAAHWMNDPLQSIAIPSDKVPHKPRADIFLTGHAYAPKRMPARSIPVHLSVGALDKRIEVWCDRGLRPQDQQILEGPRFVQMPLRWERAAGGPDTINPVGIRFGGQPDSYGMIKIPNLQPVGLHRSSISTTFSPIGFGPISAGWPGRLQWLGRHAARLSEQAWDAHPLPADLHYEYFNAAPPDQQLPEIRANERILLENLHPEHPRLVTNLPGFFPSAKAERAAGERESIRLVADTLAIDADRGRCTVTWRGTIGLRTAREAGRITVWLDDGLSREPILSALVRPSVTDEPCLDASKTMLVFPNNNAEPALPFVPGRSSLAEPDGKTPSRKESTPGIRQELPFGTGTMVVPTAADPGQTLPFETASLSSTADMDLVKILPPFVSTDASKPPFDDGSKLPLDVAPPPLMGPLATPEMVERAPENRVDVEAKALQTSLEVSVGDVQPDAFQPQEIPLEKCAALTATIARRKADKRAILEAEKLTLGQWVDVEKHWSGAIKAEIQLGKRILLDRFDEAYIAQLEQERGPIDAYTYALLVVANERGITHATCINLDLPRGSLFRIERIWGRRVAEDPRIASVLETCILTARG